MNQEINFYIAGSQDPKPQSQCTAYVDGTAGIEFRKGIDIELSHWRPNKTDDRYKGGTSTEICLNYLRQNPNRAYDLVINNHLDVDGVLSVFVLAYPTTALQYASELTKAAEAGDFWAWVDGKAFRIFQELSLLFATLDASKAGIKMSYDKCISLILQILKDPNETNEAEKILLTQYALVQEKKIFREELAQRIVSYHVPKYMVADQVQGYLTIPRFNEPISNRLAFWPQVRNRKDAEKLHLVSVEGETGINYELWIPGYCWADTKGLWQPPGIVESQSMAVPNRMQWDPLTTAIDELNRQEQSGCHWNLYPTFDFANTTNPRNFPIIMSTVNQEDHERPSTLPLETVKEAFRQLGAT